MNNDALSQYEFKNSGGLFMKVNAGEPVTIRVLTLDPLVSVDKWGGTKYSFVVWNWNENKAQIWSTTPGNLKKLVAIHRDEDFEPLNNLDVKVSATGEMLEKRYEIVPLPKAKELTREMVEEATNIKLEDKIDGGVRLSAYNEGYDLPIVQLEETSGYQKAKAVAEELKSGGDALSEDELDMPADFGI